MHTLQSELLQHLLFDSIKVFFLKSQITPQILNVTIGIGKTSLNFSIFSS